MTVAPETPEPRSPAWGRWALKNKAQPPSPLPPTSAAPSRPWPLGLSREPRSPLAPAPWTPTLSTHSSPSPAAAATSNGRRFWGRVSPPGFPFLTSFPVRAGGVGQWRRGRGWLLEKARPCPALPVRGRAHFRPTEGGALEKPERGLGGPGGRGLRAGGVKDEVRICGGTLLPGLASSASGTSRNWALGRDFGLALVC